MLWNCILLRDEITPIGRGVCRGSSLSLSPCHLVCSVACPVFTLRFLFQFVLLFLSLLVINFSFLNPSSFVLLFYGFMLFSFVRSSVSQLTFLPVPNSASSPFRTFLLTFLIPSSCVLRFIFWFPSPSFLSSAFSTSLSCFPSSSPFCLR